LKLEIENLNFLGHGARNCDHGEVQISSFQVSNFNSGFPLRQVHAAHLMPKPRVEE
jgi:hypothetical protein